MRRAVLLDTNVLSELMKATPDARVAQFAAALETPLVSAAVFHELHYGVSLLPEGARKLRMTLRIETFQQEFSASTFAIDASIARVSGQLRAEVQRRGFDLKPMDSLIAACALSRNARLATRNIKHFQRLEMDLVNPWTP